MLAVYTHLFYNAQSVRLSRCVEPYKHIWVTI
jgi:hypothetical protein